jgi:phage-related protein
LPKENRHDSFIADAAQDLQFRTKNGTIPMQKKIVVRFFRSGSGREPVREWLQELDRGDKRTIGVDIKTVEYGWPIGMPVCRPLGNGLHEVRSRISYRRISRVIFAIHASEMILLHGFIKKSQKTPTEEIALAQKRLKELQ